MQSASETNSDSIWGALRRDLGGDAVARLCEALGGLEVKVPACASKLHAEHVLVQALGMVDAAAVCRSVGGETFYIRFLSDKGADRRQEVIRLMDAGLTNVEIGKRLGISTRHARRVLADMGMTNPNRDLARRKQPAPTLIAAE